MSNMVKGAKCYRSLKLKSQHIDLESIRLREYQRVEQRK